MAMRELEVYDYSELPALFDRDCEKLIQKRYYPKLYFVDVKFTSTDAAAEVISGFTDEFNGSARAVSTIQCAAKASYSDADYFYFYLYNAGEEAHYFWYNVTGGGADPSVTGTAHEVDISGDTTAAQVAATLQGVMNAVANLTASVSTDTVTAESDNVGEVTDAALGVGTADTITTIISGTDAGTANYFYLVSSDAGDDAAGTGVRTVSIAIIDEDGNYSSTSITTDGTTIVKSSVKALRVIGGYATSWGANADADGNITLRDYGGTDVYLTIAAASNETVSSRFFIPDDHTAMLKRLFVSGASAVGAGSDVAAGTGVKLSLKIEDETDTDPDISDIFVCMHNQPPIDIKYPYPFKIDGSAQGAKITLTQEAVDGDLLADFHVIMMFIIYGTSDALRRIPA